LHKLNYIEKPIFTDTGSFKSFLRNNIRGILGTLMFHMLLLIIFLLVKINAFRQVKELNVSIDYIPQLEEEVTEKREPLTEKEKAYLEKIFSQYDENTGNRAANISQKLEEDLSTEKFVNDFRKQINEERSEEWKKQQEEINSKLNQPDFVPSDNEEKKDVELDDYSGPSNISYEFTEPPYKRYKVYLPVPVYKCQGEGTVTVNIEVDQKGEVTSAESYVSKEYPDKDCLLDVARNYALKTMFEGNVNAPRYQKARIIYNFIPQ
jgi:hypothetical protein